MQDVLFVILTGRVRYDGEPGFQRRSNDGTDTSTATPRSVRMSEI